MYLPLRIAYCGFEPIRHRDSTPPPNDVRFSRHKASAASEAVGSIYPWQVTPVFPPAE
jgi:hypothetical protein